MQNDAEVVYRLARLLTGSEFFEDPGTEGAVSARRMLSRERVSWGTRRWMLCCQERVAKSSGPIAAGQRHAKASSDCSGML